MMNEESKAKKEVEKPPIKAVLFDFDGLLFNTEPIWDKTYCIFLKNHDISPNEEVEKEMFGAGLVEAVQLMIDRMGLKGNVHDLTADYRRLFYEIFLKEKDIVMQGGRELIENAKKRGLVVGLTTGGHTEAMTRKILENANLLSYFDVVVSSDDVEKGKPAPDVYLYSADKLSIEPQACLALEDSPNGVLAAKAAGMRVFGVNADEKIRAELETAGADRIYSSLKELIEKFSTQLEQY